ncbi:hypothetical protein Tco_0381494 [Tanacetum coccineum]
MMPLFSYLYYIFSESDKLCWNNPLWFCCVISGSSHEKQAQLDERPESEDRDSDFLTSMVGSTGVYISLDGAVTLLNWLPLGPTREFVPGIPGGSIVTPGIVEVEVRGSAITIKENWGPCLKLEVDMMSEVRRIGTRIRKCQGVGKPPYALSLFRFQSNNNNQDCPIAGVNPFMHRVTDSDGMSMYPYSRLLAPRALRSNVAVAATLDCR